MPTFTIESAEYKREIPANEKRGPLAVWGLILGDGKIAKDADLLQKPDSPAPRVGETIEGTIEPGRQKDDGTRWPDSFRKAKPAFGGNGPRPEDPKRQATIIRQHSQHMALLHVEGMERRFVATEQKPRFVMDPEELRKVVNWYDDDARKAGERA